MSLLISTIRKEVKTLNKNKIRLQTIGNIEMLPDAARKELMEAIEQTSQNDRMTLILALSYSSKKEIINAVQTIAELVKNDQIEVSEIDEKVFSNALYTNKYPDPELMIRTSGETRISNFLLWQIAYAELYFTPVFWPDFRKEHFFEAILNYQNRERRFGMTSEQLDPSQ